MPALERLELGVVVDLEGVAVERSAGRAQQRGQLDLEYLAADLVAEHLVEVVDDEQRGLAGVLLEQAVELVEQGHELIEAPVDEGAKLRPRRGRLLEARDEQAEHVEVDLLDLRARPQLPEQGVERLDRLACLEITELRVGLVVAQDLDEMREHDRDHLAGVGVHEVEVVVDGEAQERVLVGDLRGLPQRVGGRRLAGALGAGQEVLGVPSAVGEGKAEPSARIVGGLAADFDVIAPVFARLG